MYISIDKLHSLTYILNLSQARSIIFQAKSKICCVHYSVSSVGDLILTTLKLEFTILTILLIIS